MTAQMGAAGIDIGAMEEAPVEEVTSAGDETGAVSAETAKDDTAAKASENS
jgi:small subunit ribosomal protein S2